MRGLATIPMQYRVVGLAGLLMIGQALFFAIIAWMTEGVPPGFANKDFANYWTAGRLILEGRTADLFGPQPDYFAHLVAAFGPDYQWHNWSYPPHYLLFVWPLGFFGYELAMALFLASTGIFFVWAARRFAGDVGPLLWLAVLAYVGHNLWVAQNGFLFAALGLGALALRAERPILAGVMLGVLTVKPQLGVLFPLLLLCERRWLVIASAVVTTLALVALSAVIFGTDAWRGYLDVVVPYQTLVMRALEGSFLTMLPSVYGSLRNWGMGPDAALALHLAFAAPVVVAAVAAFLLARSDRDRAVVLLIATFLVTPYALTYDLGLLSVAVAVLAARRPVGARSVGDGPAGGRTGNHWLSLAMLLPVVMMPLGLVKLLIAPPVILMAFWIALGHAGVLRRAGAAWRLLSRRYRGRELPAAA